MAGYFLYSFNYEVFIDLISTPTKYFAIALADYAVEEIDEDSDYWPADREALADRIIERLPRDDWYSDLSLEDAEIWNQILRGLFDEVGDENGIDFDVYDFESIYWDGAEEAARFGAAMMAEPVFGNGGFRYSGKPNDPDQPWPMYSLYPPEEAKKLLAQLEAIEPQMATLPEGEFSPKEQFFEGLLPFVREMVQRGRMIYIQTDT